MECPHRDCRRIFSTKYNLARHELTQHQHVRSHLCQYCFKAFSSKQNRLTHEYRHRSPPVESIPTDVSVPKEPYETCVPKLTALVALCANPDFRPFAKVVKVFFWPDRTAVAQLPKIRQAGEREDAKPLPRCVADGEV